MTEFGEWRDRREKVYGTDGSAARPIEAEIPT
jgi:hypothetical protein